MAYTTASGTSTDAADVFAGETGLPEERLDPLLRQAERLVLQYAPAAPDPVTEEYTQAISDSELQVFDYLVTAGFTSSTSVSGIGVSYRTFDDVAAIVRVAMAGLDSSSETGDSNTAYIEWW